MQAVKILFSLGLIVAANQAFAEDEYEYMQTPNAQQIADLQDDDDDGVINARDLCPDTPATSEIDNDGCGEYIKSSEQMQVRVLFANDSDEINPVFHRQ
ncbi:OmpA family protein, partial [Vibrio harveyi]